jgi:O-antigen ligase
LLFALIFLFSLLPWLNAFAPGPSVAAVPLLFSLACFTAASFLRSSSSENNKKPIVEVSALLAAALISSSIGLAQYNGLVEQLSPWISGTNPGEAFANLRQRNQFASLTNVGVAALLWWAAHHSVNITLLTHRIGVNGLFLAMAILLAVGNAASGSRTGFFQLISVCVLALWWGGWRARTIRWVLVASLAAYLASALMLPIAAGLDASTHGALARLQAGDAPCASRLTLWSNVIDLIQQKPLLGWGWGNLDYAHFITLYPGERFCDILDNAHNLPLHLAVELGVPFAVLFCGVVIWRIARLKPWAETDRTRQFAWMVLMVIGLHSMVEYPLWYGPFQMTVALCVWMLWTRPTESSEQIRAPRTSISNRPLPHALSAGAATILIAIVALVGWDYYRVSQIYLAPADRGPAYQEATLEKSSQTWFFKDTARFAQMTLTPLTQANAAEQYALALRLLHYSPEPRVVERLVESATMLGEFDEAVLHLARFKAAFPKEHAVWREKMGIAAR